jgi:DNA-binding NarL/FixJ family response regulator
MSWGQLASMASLRKIAGKRGTQFANAAAAHWAMVVLTREPGMFKLADECRSRVFLLDCHPLMRRGVAAIVAEQPDLVLCGEESNSPESLRHVRRAKPQIVILEIRRADGSSGLDLIRQICRYCPEARPLAFSLLDESLYAERALNAGALGFVSKEAGGDVLIKAVRQVLDGGIYLSPQMVNRVLHRAVYGKNGVRQTSIDQLSARELQVFELLGNGYTTRQVGNSLHLSIKTVETHRENIKAKLQLANGAELVRHAVQWVLERSEPCVPVLN